MTTRLTISRQPCYVYIMANLQVKNMPDTLHRRLREHAREHGHTMRDLVIAAIERELSRREWRERWEQRPVTDLDASAASLLDESGPEFDERPR